MTAAATERLLRLVRKIRVDSDNKRCARCAGMALAQSRKVNINEYINKMESA